LNAGIDCVAALVQLETLKSLMLALQALTRFVLQQHLSSGPLIQVPPACLKDCCLSLLLRSTLIPVENRLHDLNCSFPLFFFFGCIVRHVFLFFVTILV
jgi:hypothetical protein